MDIVFQPNQMNSVGQPSGSRHQRLYKKCQDGKGSWTCKQHAEKGNLYLFWFGGDSEKVVAVGVVNSTTSREDDNPKSEWHSWYECKYQPLIWLKQPGGWVPEELARRKAFGGKWSRLNQCEADGAVPAIGDEQTVTWALGKKLGETLVYTDERGRIFKIRIVEVLASSVLQGGLVISEKNFVERFPAMAGYRVFLIDTPLAKVGAVVEELSRGLQSRGLEVVSTWRRLAEFQAVENTYLGIFQALGGLGLLLGSAGLGIVVLRNVLERRGELALLQAVGFRRSVLQRLVLSEHWLLVLLGVGLGMSTALVAVWPARDAGVPVVTLIVLTGGGLSWCWLSAWVALRKSLLPVLRNE